MRERGEGRRTDVLRGVEMGMHCGKEEVTRAAGADSRRRWGGSGRARGLCESSEVPCRFFGAAAAPP